MTAPSPKEALELKPCPFCNTAPAFGRMIEPDHVTIGCNNDGCLVQLCIVSDSERDAVKAWNTRATLQPSGERREAINQDVVDQYLDDILRYAGTALHLFTKECKDDMRHAMSDILASGLVLDEAGWRDISTAPKDGTPFIGAFWSIRWADSHRKGDVVTCWWQPEFEAFISACREMSLAPGLTFENGETRKLHSPVIEPVTHWKPLDRPAIRSARDGGAETWG